MDFILGNLQSVVFQSARMFRELVPYVLVGAVLGAWVRGMRRVPALDRLSSSSLIVVLPVASLLGTVSPLCTMGTVPLLAGLVGRGFPPGGLLAFLASSSMVSPQLLVLTVGTVGWPLALARWGAAVAVGISAGGLAEAGARAGWRIYALRAAQTHAHAPDEPPRRFRDHFLDNLEFVALPLVVGVILAAGINVFLPAGYLVRWLGPENAFAVVASALVAIPFYVCGGGILPAMQVLMEKGVPAGVVLAFFISGPATRVQILAALGAVLGRRALVGFVVLVLAWAVLLGFAFNRLPVAGSRERPPTDVGRAGSSAEMPGATDRGTWSGVPLQPDGGSISCSGDEEGSDGLGGTGDPRLALRLPATRTGRANAGDGDSQRDPGLVQ